MMKISFVIDSDFFCSNKIFDETNLLVNRDDCQRPWIELRKALARLNIYLDTFDLSPIEECDLVCFLNTPKSDNKFLLKAIYYQKPCYLIIHESELIHTANSNDNLHTFFQKIFTYQNRLIDNIKYIKLNYSFDFHRIKQLRSENLCDKNKLSVMVAGNKLLNRENELYSQRVKTIRWYEKNNPKEFDLYGTGWNLNLPIYRKLFTRTYKLYRGPVIDKIKTISSYKFNYCYENAIIDGYITEKFFDTFSANSVPIYWGCNSISKYIKEDCFINRGNFKDDKELYLFLSSMSGDEYNKYQSNISLLIDHLCIDKDFEFGIEFFKNTIINELNKDFNYEY